MGRGKKKSVAGAQRRERLFSLDQPTTTSLIWITGAISV
jgi:hypothetical protein